MIKKFFTLLLLMLTTGAIWLAQTRYEDTNLSPWLHTFIALTLLYFVFKVLLEGVLARRIQDSKSRYKFRKTFSLLYILIFSIVLIRVWIENPQSLLVAYGLVGAGVAISLQDIFKNFVGGFALLVNNTYRVGDRIEIDGSHGDVIDIGLFYTTLLELRQWVNGDQATGRLSVIPNGKTLGGQVHNYTKDHHFIWDELTIPITYGSNWKKAVELIEDAVTDYTQVATERAEQGIARISEKYYLSRRNTQPSVFVSMTDNWIDFHIRYVSEVRDRRLTHNEISKIILDAILHEDDIAVASETLTITNQ